MEESVIWEGATKQLPSTMKKSVRGTELELKNKETPDFTNVKRRNRRPEDLSF